MELYIIRHGQSQNNALMENQHLRVEDPLLTEAGEQQAQHVARFLADTINLEDLVRKPVDDPARGKPHPYQFTHLYCSPMIRTMQTIQPIGETLGITPEIWIDIHEHGGIFLKKDGVTTGYGGQKRQQIVERFPNFVIPDAITEEGWWNPANGMEHIAGCHARAIRVAMDLRKRAQDKESRHDKIAIVSHGMFIDSLLKALTNTLPTNQHFHWHYNTAITRVDFVEHDVVIIRYVNRVTHLPPELIT